MKCVRGIREKLLLRQRQRFDGEDIAVREPFRGSRWVRRGPLKKF